MLGAWLRRSRRTASASTEPPTGSPVACGRRPSDLETPYEASVEARKEAQDQKKTPLPPEPQKPEKDKRFFLDGLID